jgi:hypothetical protein
LFELSCQTIFLEPSSFSRINSGLKPVVMQLQLQENRFGIMHRMIIHAFINEDESTYYKGYVSKEVVPAASANSRRVLALNVCHTMIHNTGQQVHQI